ncbi:TPA: ShlB/FhaC/HecB family hemolysin secretion/activation protein [Pseudomonas putida]
MSSGQCPAQGFFLCVLFSCLIGTAWASPGDQDLIRERQNRLLEEQQRRLDDLRNLPGQSSVPALPAHSEDARCFTIRTIELKGAESLSTFERDKLLKPFVGQCLGVAELNALLRAITDHYLARGLVTSRAYLPQQDLSSGHLRVLVVEGRVEGVRPEKGSGLSERELAMTFPSAPGELLNLREIEQMVDQLNRLPSNKTQMELRPGEKVGGSQVLVRNAPRKHWRASLSRNNEGLRSTGEQQANLGFEWDSPLGLADQLVLRSGHDVVSDHVHGSKNSAVYYNLPWGWWSFSYSYNESDYRSQAQANGFDFKQTGDSQNHQLRAERVVHRDTTSKTSLSAGLAHLRTNNYIEGSRLDASSNRLSEAQFGINHGRRLGSAFINIDLGMQQGTSAFDAQDNGHPRAGEPVARYRKYTATISFVQGFQVLGENLSFSSLANGQRSEDVLFSPQRISLGGLASVRGLKDQSLAGDSGGYWRSDLRWSRPVTWPALRPMVSEYGIGLGYDLGVIRNDRYNGDYHGRASSHSFELFARGEHVAASVSFAHSLERPDVLPDKERPVYFRLDFFI